MLIVIKRSSYVIFCIAQCFLHQFLHGFNVTFSLLYYAFYSLLVKKSVSGARMSTLTQWWCIRCVFAVSGLGKILTISLIFLFLLFSFSICENPSSVLNNYFDRKIINSALMLALCPIKRIMYFVVCSWRQVALCTLRRGYCVCWCLI